MLFRSISNVSIFIFISRILGFARDMLSAQLFGGSLEFDAFVVAYRIPNFLRRLFAEGAFSQALIPVFGEILNQENAEKTKAFINELVGTYSLIVFLISVLLFIAAPQVIFLFAPGFSHNPEQLHLAGSLLRIMAVFVGLVSITAMFSALLNCYHYYVTAVACQLLMNVTILSTLGYMLFTHQPQIEWLAYAVPIGASLMALQQTLHFRRVFGGFSWRLNWRSPYLRRIFKLTSVSLFSVSVAQIGLMIDNILASWLPTGSITWLYYGERLVSFPNGLIGAALSIVVLPYLSKFIAAGDEKRYLAYQRWSTQLLLLVALPATLGLFLLATPIMSTLFHYGAFDTHDTLMSAAALRAFSLGLPAIMLNRVLTTTLFAEQQHKAVAKQSVIALVANIILDLILIWPLQHVGLAWALTLSSWFRTYLLARILIRHHPQLAVDKALLTFSSKILIACAAMATFILGFQLIAQIDWLTCSAHERFLWLILIVIMSKLAYLATLRLTGTNLKEFLLHREIV